MHSENAFITLTYKDIDHPSLDHQDFQKFMKRLRKKINRTIRFYMCGEYGVDQDDLAAGMKNPGLGRKHFHALIFGYQFPDKYEYKRTPAGEIIYRSETLEKLWPLGHSSTAELTYETAAYVARYVTKKITGDIAHDHYQVIDKHTGEIHQVKPEYTSMSGGIGKSWLEKYHTDVFPSDEVLVKTKTGIKKIKTPAYYTRWLKKHSEKLHDDIKQRRKENAKKHKSNNTPERLETRLYLQENKAAMLKRK